MEYKIVGKFLVDIKKEFGREDEELLKIVKLKEIEQENRIMEEYVQDFKRAAKGSSYVGCLLIKEFKWNMNRAIRRKLMKAEK